MSTNTKKERDYVGIVGKILGVLMFIRVLFIPQTSSMNIGIILQGVAFVTIGVFAVFFNKFSKKLQIFICIVFLIPVVFVSFLAIYGNRVTATFDEDVIIVLGAGIVGERVSNPLARRLDTAIYYFEHNPNAYIIVCGGLGDRLCPKQVKCDKLTKNESR